MPGKRLSERQMLSATTASVAGSNCRNKGGVRRRTFRSRGHFEVSSFGTEDSGLIRKSVTRCTSPVSVRGASFLAFLALLTSAMAASGAHGGTLLGCTPVTRRLLLLLRGMAHDRSDCPLPSSCAALVYFCAGPLLHARVK